MVRRTLGVQLRVHGSVHHWPQDTEIFLLVYLSQRCILGALSSRIEDLTVSCKSTGASEENVSFTIGSKNKTNKKSPRTSEQIELSTFINRFLRWRRSETSDNFQQATRRYVPEYRILHDPCWKTSVSTKLHLPEFDCYNIKVNFRGRGFV